MDYIRENYKKTEILAPAGSYESFLAAITAGADAVYAGGPRFGARAFADNFSEAQLLEAIDYAHLHGRRFYLTVNTLLKDTEVSELYAYLEPLYEGGLDAVIVQDIGVLAYVRDCFPGLEIHASTQMTITGTGGAEFLRDMGAVRVVPARELSLEEIRRMKTQTGMEIECFVHGALCYCYSGQCLFSSLIGGRSGNRGQCAQPCRLPYTAEGEKGYLLSPKDICTLELIPQLIEAGIDSFKIEGRMKRPEYVAGVTSMYRKYTDLYLEKGRKNYRVLPEDREMLMDLFNRGGFHTGYYQQRNGRDMIAISRPNHAGVPAVKVLSQRGRELTCKTLTTIHKGDVLEFPAEKAIPTEKRKTRLAGQAETAGGKDGYTFGTDWPKGREITILAPKGRKIAAGSVLHRIRNQQLLDTLGENGQFGKIQEKIYGFLKLSVGKPATLVVCFGDVFVEKRTEMPVQEAQKSPLDEECIRRQMRKTGNTEFLFDKLDIELDGDVFLPMQQLNELRRAALEELQEQICRRYHRERPEEAACQKGRDLQKAGPEEQPVRVKETRQEADSRTDNEAPYISVLVETAEQLQAVFNSCAVSGSGTISESCAASRAREIRRIYLDGSAREAFFDEEKIVVSCQELRSSGIELYLALPHVFREQTRLRFMKILESGVFSQFDGFLIRNYESFQFLKQSQFDKNVILDHNLYVFNQYAKTFWEQRRISAFTVPVELNRQEIGKLGAHRAELIVYGYYPVMVSAQCVKKTVSGCTGKESCIVLKDRYQNPFQIKSYCRDCYNVIYNSAPLCLYDQKTALDQIAPAGFRLQFSAEDFKETSRILDQCRCMFSDDRDMEAVSGGYTRGHFKRGIT